MFRVFAVVFLMVFFPSNAPVLAETGALTQLAGTDACISQDGSGGACADGVGLTQPGQVVVSGDGRSVYVVGDRVLAVFARNRKTGALTQLPGTDACVSHKGSDKNCADGGVGLNRRSEIRVAVSPDGKNVYVTDNVTVSVFARKRKTGALTLLPGTDGCISSTGSGGACAQSATPFLAQAVAVSPDGKHVYVMSGLGHAVTVFARNRKTGALSPLGFDNECIDGPTQFTKCDALQVIGSYVATVSPDRRSLYASSGGQLGADIYVRNRKSGALTRLDTPACGGDGLKQCQVLLGDFAQDIIISPNGKRAYLSGYEAIAVFARNRRSGVLELLDHVSARDIGSDGDHLDIAVSRDGKNAYVVSSFDGKVVVLTLDRKTGALDRLTGIDGCISETGNGGACRDGVGLLGVEDVAVSPDGKSVYVVSDQSNAVAVFARSTKKNRRRPAGLW